MSLNPHMQAFITHGRYDLVTPYYASDRLRNLMRLDPEMASRLTVRHFAAVTCSTPGRTAGASSPPRSPRSSPLPGLDDGMPAERSPVSGAMNVG